MTKILDGKWLASQFYKSIKVQADKGFEENARRPGLGVILVGDNPASRSYISTKEKVANKECGFETFDAFLSEDSSYQEVASAINDFNANPNVDGILLQLPLPKHLETHSLIDLIDPDKDADGLHPYNQGLLLRGEGVLKPCTPRGVMEIIDYSLSGLESGTAIDPEVDLQKKDLSSLNAVVIGRSILVGKPVASLLLERNATVTQVHSRTKNIEEICRSADIIVAAVGIEKLVNSDWIKEGAIVIDVGINRNSAGKLVGDVDYESVLPKVKAITPVPGGVGPMTVAMLMKNTLLAYQKNINKSL